MAANRRLPCCLSGIIAWPDGLVNGTDGAKMSAGRMLDRKDFICYHWYMHRIAFGKFTMGYPDAIPDCLPDGYGSGRERRTYIQ